MDLLRHRLWQPAKKFTIPTGILWGIGWFAWENFKHAIFGWTNRYLSETWGVIEPAIEESAPFVWKFGVPLFLIVPAALVVLGVYRIGRKDLFRPSDAWAERDHLEIYVIANLSCGREPHAIPINQDPELNRLRLLKDAIRDGQLRAKVEGDDPNLWATVTLQDLKAFAAKRSHPQFLSIVKKWEKYHSKQKGLRERDRFRLRLAELRTAGVAIRNQGQSLHTNDLMPWIGAVGNWEKEVVNTVIPHDEADAEWFKTLDAVPSPRVSFNTINNLHAKYFRQHDYRLVKLEQLIQRYSHQ